MASLTGWDNARADQDLAVACSTEAHIGTIDESDALNLEPTPKTIWKNVKMPAGTVKDTWLKSIKAELKNLMDTGTFTHDEIQHEETSTTVMEAFKVKIKSDGSLDKLKIRLVVCSDLQNNSVAEDKRSPLASFQSLKMFLAHASKLKSSIKQQDFIGAFLQAKVRSRIFITIPNIFGILYPEYSKFCGTPACLAKSMYGMTLSGKYWYLELKEFLESEGFVPSENIKCLFIKQFDDKTILLLLNYVDDMLYLGKNNAHISAFKRQLKQQFNLEFLGQAHWYLATQVDHLANYDIELDQIGYCQSIIRKSLDTAGCQKDNSVTTTPLPLDFVPTSGESAPDMATTEQLSREYNIDFASCIGSLIYLTAWPEPTLFTQ